MLKLNQIIELQIDKLSFGGDGVGRHNNFVIFVPFSAPGDLVKVKISESKKSYARADIIEIIKPSDDRVSPLCPSFGVCGGCQWQHISYAKQVEEKRQIFLEMAKKEGFPLENIEISPSKAFAYRNRVQVRAFRNKLGFYQKKSNVVTDIQKCFIAEDLINSSIQDLRKRLPLARETKFEIYKVNDNETFVSENRQHGEELGFSQNNESCNQKLIANMISHLSDASASIIWDLYCGKGNFSIPLAKAYPNKQIVGVESNPSSIRAAKEAAAGLSNLTFHHADVKKWLGNKENKDPSVLPFIILDPPRVGCDVDFLNELLKLPLAGIVYVSCNPSVLFRDLKKILSLQSDLKIKSTQIFDMFPQTFHFEVMIVLSK